MHEAPSEAWSIERLAEVSGMSRTAFATKFKEKVGQSPAQTPRGLEAHTSAIAPERGGNTKGAGAGVRLLKSIRFNSTFFPEARSFAAAMVGGSMTLNSQMDVVNFGQKVLTVNLTV